MIIISNKLVLTILTVLAWIIFVGISIEVCALIVNAIFTLTASPETAKKIWQLADLSALRAYDRGHFIVVISIMTIVAMTKATMFYLIIKALNNKKLSFSQPFNQTSLRFIFGLSYCALLIGIFSRGGSNYAEWLEKKGIVMPDPEQLRLDGADVWLFMCVVLFMVAQIFKRGIEIQTENELTV